MRVARAVQRARRPRACRAPSQVPARPGAAPSSRAAPRRRRCRCAPRSPCCARSSRASGDTLSSSQSSTMRGSGDHQSDRLAARVPGEDAAPVGFEQPLEREIAARGEQAVRILQRPFDRRERVAALRARLALHLLSTVVVERLHDAGACNLTLRAGRRCSSCELEGVLLEELVEHLAAERADGVDLVGSPDRARAGSRRAAAARGRRPPRRPAAGSYWLCSEQQWITEAWRLRALFSVRKLMKLMSRVG